MRRIIHNTTAIVTCLSLLVPQIAAAQTNQTEEPKDGLGAILSQVQKAVEDNNKAAQAEAQPEAPPAPKPAAKAAQAEAAQAEAAPKDQSVEDLEAALGAGTAQDEVAQPAKEEKKPRAKPKRDAQDDTPAAQVQAEEAAPARKPKTKSDANADEAEPGLLGQLADDLRKKDQPEEGAKQDNPKADSTGRLSLATGDLQTERAAQMPKLATILADEISGGLQSESLNCLQGGRFPCADGDRAMTPRGVVIERNGNGQLRLAATENQMYRVDGAGELVQRAAEENTKETEASREAAQQSEPVSAAALEAGYSPSDRIEDGPLTIRIPGGRNWSPQNYTRRYYGQVT
ncbi:MAG: hypothetical protein L0G27_06465, partial [Paracoccus sp. (in: a-proteobacteria)]|nr:hypothetical protein [Paracoccus sp. (in: a-proteobacteria)]